MAEARPYRFLLAIDGSSLANVVVGSTALQVMHRSEIPVTLVK